MTFSGGSSPPLGDGPSSWKVAIADDHAIVRRGLRELLQGHFRIKDFLELTSCRELRAGWGLQRVDLLFLDLQLSDGNAFDLIGHLRREHPSTRILVYSMGAEHIYAPQAMDRGAYGYLSKQAAEPEILRAVVWIMSGRKYLSQEAESLQQEGEGSERPLNAFSMLTERETSVMHALLEGSGVREIARRMDLQPSTVATFKARLLNKLGVSNLLELQRKLEANKGAGQ